MGTAWDRAINNLPKRDERKQVLENLAWFEDNTGGLGGRIAPNIRNDRFLSDDAAASLVAFFRDLDRSLSDIQLRDQYDSICYKHVRCGDKVRCSPAPRRLGRASEVSAYVHGLSARVGRLPDRLRSLLADLELGTLTATQRKLLTSFPMSDYGCWVTWDEGSVGDEHPFEFSPDRCSIEIRVALGLRIDDRLRSEPVYLFEYSSADAATLYRPTVADAASHLRFKPSTAPPPDSRDWYGRTLPWHQQVRRHGSKDSSYPPRRPEAVHEAIAFPRSIKCSTAEQLSSIVDD